MEYTFKTQYERLANRIIIQACRDYRRAIRKLKKIPDDTDAYLVKNEIEDFFGSEYFGRLADVDPERLIMRLNNM